MLQSVYAKQVPLNVLQIIIHIFNGIKDQIIQQFVSLFINDPIYLYYVYFTSLYWQKKKTNFKVFKNLRNIIGTNSMSDAFLLHAFL